MPDLLEIAILVIAGVVAAVLLAVFSLIHRLRRNSNRHDPRSRELRGMRRPVRPLRDESYIPPPHAAPEDEEPSSVDAPASRRPRRQLLDCPRCGQAIARVPELERGRLVCPVCGCKFYPPRGDSA